MERLLKLKEPRGFAFQMLIVAALIMSSSPKLGFAADQGTAQDIVLEAGEGNVEIPLVYVMMSDCVGLTSPKKAVKWSVTPVASGKYTVIVTGARGQGPSEYAVSVGDQTVTGKITNAEPNWCIFADDVLGDVELAKDKPCDVAIKATVMPKKGTPVVVQFRRITLRPDKNVVPPAGVKLHRLFGDNAVLQCDMSVPVWGAADSGEKVTVKIGAQTKTATAEKDGRWKATLDPMKAGGPFTMTVAGKKNTITLQNILVGEVWVSSGQSNARMSLNIVKNSAKEMAAANYPKIRAFTVPIRAADAPQSEINAGSWIECNPKTAAMFPGLAYFFAREIHTTRNVPVGIINSSVGATPAEHWTSKKALESDPATAGLVGQPQDPCGLWPACLYNGMIAPLIPYGIRGAIWYQAESNTGRHDQYAKLFPNMIKGWRQDWGQGDFPFGFVQLPNCGMVGLGGTWASMREAQTSALSLPKVGMVVAIDAGVDNAAVPDQVHAPNKQDVGKRMGFWAEHDVYGMDIAGSGPMYESMKVEGNKIVLSFKNVGGGLMMKGAALTGFTISGGKSSFVAADANIEGNTVVVSSASVANPTAVRYGWADAPKCNLYNKDELPVAPFRTDR